MGERPVGLDVSRLGIRPGIKWGENFGFISKRGSDPPILHATKLGRQMVIHAKNVVYFQSRFYRPLILFNHFSCAPLDADRTGTCVHPYIAKAQADPRGWSIPRAQTGTNLIQAQRWNPPYHDTGTLVYIAQAQVAPRVSRVLVYILCVHSTQDGSGPRETPTHPRRGWSRIIL